MSLSNFMNLCYLYVMKIGTEEMAYATRPIPTNGQWC